MTDVQVPEAPGAVPLPPDFPVVWDTPDDESRFWIRDRMHRPDQISHLEFTLGAAVFEPGFTAACSALRMPISRWDARRINSYEYVSMQMATGTPEEMEALGREAQERIGGAMGTLARDWSQTHLPEILEHIATLAAVDLSVASAPDLAGHLEEVVRRSRRLWEIHFLVVFPAYTAISEFDEMYRTLFGSDDPFGAYTLLQGFPNKTVETGHALWQVSRRARQVPEVLDALRRDAAEVPKALGTTDAGRTFLAEFQDYLETYGHRGDCFGYDFPFWVEDPTPAVRTLQEYVGQDDDADPAAEMARQAAAREAAVAEARRTLESHPPEVRDGFGFLLRAAQEGNVLTEDHGFYIDYRGGYQVRRAIVTSGTALRDAGSFDATDDVFMLTLDELLDVLRSPRDVRGIVAERRAELARWADVAAPDGIGTPQPEGPQNPVGRAMAKFFGRGGPPSTGGQAAEIAGQSGSTGVARGTARILTSIAEADKLRPGDVLVAETTAPPWTPLFAVAGAVVTDTGGILSHCAVVAREYGIPAVVGCITATTSIRDGQQVEVDGAAGVVRLLD